MADVHHGVVGHGQSEQDVGALGQGCAGPRDRDQPGALGAGDVDRVEQRGHAAHVRDGDHHAARPLRAGRHLLQVIVGPGIGRQAETEEARLQVGG